MIVVDASLAFEIMLASQRSDVLSDLLLAKGDVLCAPEIIELELLQTLRRLVYQGSVTEALAAQAIDNLNDLRIERFSHNPLRRRIWSLRHYLTAYDAAYFALAELLEAPLWTLDRKYLSVPGQTAQIEIL
ncbi:MAG: type II toxin-antitoxin system VapC family toxin [Pseudomonadota bacterium]